MKSYFSRYSSVTTMLKELKWEQLKKCRKRNRLTMFYKAVNGLVAKPTDEPSAQLDDVLTPPVTSFNCVQIPKPYVTVSSIVPSETGTTYQTIS